MTVKASNGYSQKIQEILHKKEKSSQRENIKKLQ